MFLKLLSQSHQFFFVWKFFVFQHDTYNKFLKKTIESIFSYIFILFVKKNVKEEGNKLFIFLKCFRIHIEQEQI